MSPQKNHILTVDTINPNILKVEYAVRGELAILAESIRQDLGSLNSKSKHSFDEIVNCNIGNPQQLNQTPISFFRQISAIVECPLLLNNPLSEKIFYKSALQRAKYYLDNVGSVGAYSHSQGVPFIRQRVAEYIMKRDQVEHEANKDNIFLTNGASSGVQLILQLIIQNNNVGIMTPIPQYPLYSATISMYGGKAVPYYLDEEPKWTLTKESLMEALQKAKESRIDTRALAVINPGNPTGQCLSIENMELIIKFCYENKLVLLADEVYQTNIYTKTKFNSFRRVMMRMDPKYHIELVSFHSISKGMIGECGRRGGYFELCNFEPDVISQIYKICSVNLCPNVQGQLMVDMMLNPPTEKDDAYTDYNKEINMIYESLKRRSIMLCEAFNKMEKISCNYAEGALYLFPKIELSKKALIEAKNNNKEPDVFYCINMLKETGVCMVPGSGFGQKNNTLHFRATFLPQEHQMKNFINNLTEFHKRFMEKYKD